MKITLRIDNGEPKSLAEVSDLLQIGETALRKVISARLKHREFSFEVNGVIVHIESILEFTTTFTLDGREFKTLRELADFHVFDMDETRDSFDEACISGSKMFIVSGKTVEFTTEEKDLKHLTTLSIEESTNVDNDHRWSVSDDIYVWKGRDVNYTIGVSLADKLFFDYSRYGMDLSVLEIRNKYDIPLKLWNSLKDALQLYKESDILSPWSRGQMSIEEYRKHAQSAIEKLSGNKKRIVVEEYTKHYVKKSKKFETEALKKVFDRDILIQELTDWVTTRNTEKLPLIYSETGTGHITVVLSDVHIGLEETDRHTISEYNTKIVHELFNRVADVVNSKNPESVDVILAGDLIHSFTGGMHQGMWKEMERGMHGAGVIRRAVELIESMISKISNVKSIKGVGGNHDRYSDKKQSNTVGELGNLIFWILERSFPDIEVSFDDYLVTWKGPFSNFVLLHGDTDSVNKTAKLVLDNMVNLNPSKFTYVISGDKHCRRILSDTRLFRHISLPPISGTNEYAMKLGLDSASGFTLFSAYDNKTLSVEEISLL